VVENADGLEERAAFVTVFQDVDNLPPHYTSLGGSLTGAIRNTQLAVSNMQQAILF
jgi:hypothetical protein